MRLQSVLRVHVLRALDSEFGVSLSESVTKHAAIAEHLRAVLTLKSLHDAGRHPVPVSTASVAVDVRRRLSSLWPDLVHEAVEDDVVLSSIEHLSNIGEIFRTDSSQWIPAPPRVVYIDENTRLLLSSMPLQLLTFRLRRSTQVIGRARVVDVSVFDSTKSIVVQRPNEWMQCRYNDIADWGKTFIAHNAIKMSAVDGLEHGEVFIEGRWRKTDSFKEVVGKIQLYRRRVYIHGNPTNEYALCTLRDVKNGGVDVKSIVAITKHDARRLQGALKLGDGRRRSMRLHCQAGVATLFLVNPLPYPENAFLSLGWVCTEQSPKDWPKKYFFSERLVPLLKTALGLLGYDTEER